MRALVVEELLPDYAGCVVKEIPTPEPAAGEVRIKVRAAAVNFPDLMQTRGEHQHKPAVPFVGGLELAGEVDALGEGVTGFPLGEAVVAGGRGGFAEYAILPAATLRKKPANLSFSQAAGYPVAYLTAYVALTRCAQAQPGEWVLVHGASGGVGLAAVDYARLLGCKVIAASASDEKLAVIEREYAPDATVNVTRGFRERVKELTGGRGADVIYDPVGGDVFDESTRCIAFGRPHPLHRLHLGPPAGAAGQHRAHQGLLGDRRSRRRIRSPVPRKRPREQPSHLEARRRRPGEAPRRRRIPARPVARRLRFPRRPQGDRQDHHPAGSLRRMAI